MAGGNSYRTPGELVVCPDHPRGRLEAVVRDLFCRSEDQVFLVLPPAQDHRRQHDPRGDGGLRVLLADEEVELPDQLVPRLGIVGAEDGRDEVENPLLGALPEGRAPGKVDDP
jgi:hypothetical protein